SSPTRPTTPDQCKQPLPGVSVIMPWAGMRPPWGLDGAQAEPRSLSVLPSLWGQGRISAPTSSAVARHRYAVSPFAGRQVGQGAQALDYAADTAGSERRRPSGRARGRGPADAGRLLFAPRRRTRPVRV